VHSMSVTLEIDHREAHLIEQFRATGFDDYTTANMDVGDIRFVWQDACALVIERKTLQDLSQSITDSRYRDQKRRMTEKYGYEKVMYVIEGADVFCADPTNASRFSLPPDRLKGAIINTLVRDRMRVVCVKNVASTAVFVREVLERLRKDPASYIKNPGEATASEVSHAKSAHMTKDTFGGHALSLIPGVSLSIAKVIMDCYKDIGSLIQTGTWETIADLKHGGGAGRRIGPKVAQRVIEFLK
jgi:ERCC4-type nuclease